MKYYKTELWTDFQSIEDSEESEKIWEENARKYLSQLEQLKERLSAKNFRFFRHDSLHDGVVGSFNIVNKTNLLMKENNNYRNTKYFNNPIVITLEVLSGDFLYSLKFSKVTSFNIIYPKEQLLPGPSGFGDWGYAELTPVDETTLSYEVIFSSGGTLLIEFSMFSYNKKRFIK
jgi:hypothetical protein